MRAKVSKIYECPRCEMDMSDVDRPKKCPKCHFRFAEPEEELTEKYHWPKDITRQYFELVQQDYDKFRDKPLHEIIKGFPEEKSKELHVSNQKRKELIQKFRGKERDDFLLKTEPEDIEGTIKTIHYLMTLSLSSGNYELIKALAVWGLEIGTMAQVLTDYVKLNGRSRQVPLSKELEDTPREKLIEYLKTLGEQYETSQKRRDERDSKRTRGPQPIPQSKNS